MTQKLGKIDNTFLRYNDPVLVTKHVDKMSKADLEVRAQQQMESNDEVQNALNTIFPPILKEEDGALWEYTVSNAATAVEDLEELVEALDQRLKVLQARETGVCPIRRIIYTHLYDELMRQVTVSCPERGLLMMRLRDELAASIEAFEHLYGSSLSFGLRKVVVGDVANHNLAAAIKELERDKVAMASIIDDLREAGEDLERQHAELRGLEFLKYSEEVTVLKKTNLLLKSQLENLLAPKK